MFPLWRKPRRSDPGQLRQRLATTSFHRFQGGLTATAFFSVQIVLLNSASRLHRPANLGGAARAPSTTAPRVPLGLRPRAVPDASWLLVVRE